MRPSLAAWQRLLPKGRYLAVANFATWLMMSSPPIYLAKLMGLEAAALFNAIRSPTSAINPLYQSIDVFLSPRVRSLDSLVLMRHFGLDAVAVTLVVTLLFCPLFFVLWFNPGLIWGHYRPSWMDLVLLYLSAVLSVIAFVCNVYLRKMNHERSILNVVLLWSPVGFIGGLGLAVILGVSGVFLALALYQFAVCSFLVFRLSRVVS
jgi:O-antigen/teichoic acid export membrane protein